MNKQFLLGVILIMTCAMLLIGCGDDPETVVAGSSTQAVFLGEASLYPYAYFYADIMPVNNAADFGLDSVTVYDTTCEYREDSYYYVYGDNDYQWAEYYNRADSFRYSSGDTAHIAFFRNGQQVMTEVALLDYDDDFQNVILPIDDDTVSLGSGINCLWNSVPKADWYGLRFYTYYDSAGTYAYRSVDTALTDTSFTIPPAMTIYNGYIYIYVYAVSGPGPNDPPNVSGNGMYGYIVSQARPQNTIRIYTGNGDPNPVSGSMKAAVPDPEQVDKEFMTTFFGKQVSLPVHQHAGQQQ